MYHKLNVLIIAGGTVEDICPGVSILHEVPSDMPPVLADECAIRGHLISYASLPWIAKPRRCNPEIIDIRSSADVVKVIRDRGPSSNLIILCCGIGSFSLSDSGVSHYEFLQPSASKQAADLVASEIKARHVGVENICKLVREVNVHAIKVVFVFRGRTTESMSDVSLSEMAKNAVKATKFSFAVAADMADPSGDGVICARDTATGERLVCGAPDTCSKLAELACDAAAIRIDEMYIQSFVDRAKDQPKG